MNALDVNEAAPPGHIADAHVHRLLIGYARLVGAPIRKIGTSVFVLELPEAERRHFNNRSPEFSETGRLRVSTDPAARVDDVDVELAVSGSAFLEQLVTAIRERGHRLRLGLLAPGGLVDPGFVELSVPAEGLAVSSPRISLTVHPIGRLLVRVLVRAGAAAEELLAESDIFDMAGGGPVPREVADQCAAAIAGSFDAVAVPREALVKEPKSIESLLPLMVQDLETRLAPDLERRREEAEKARSIELARIDLYYGTLLDGAAGAGTDIPTAEARRAFEAEHARRRQEEIARHEVRATIQPVQLTEWGLLVQDAEWELTSRAGRRGTIAATRPLIGAGVWTLRCPTCGDAPPSLRVCREEHVCCSGCSQSCALCGETTCREHAPSSCHVDLASMCAEHARTCLVCRRPACAQHLRLCADGDHRACSACIVKCGVCGRRVCTSHMSMSPASAPRGSRPLCGECVVLCEGGKNEPVGKDEVVRCASCDRHVCGAHQATCAVDQGVHCSAHLRRADRSRRLVCERHQAACAYEPAAVLASDEVLPCATCGAKACAEHVATCLQDVAVHCRRHLVAVTDQQGRLACELHRALCHVDQQTYSLAAVSACPVCGRGTCGSHFALCGYCSRAVCSADLERTSGRCTTCRRLSEPHPPLDVLLAAATTANGGTAPSARTWRSARDAASTVVDIDLGWSRHLVFTVEHGQSAPHTVMAHSLLGSRRKQ